MYKFTAIILLFTCLYYNKYIRLYLQYLYLNRHTYILKLISSLRYYKTTINNKYIKLCDKLCHDDDFEISCVQLITSINVNKSLLHVMYDVTNCFDTLIDCNILCNDLVEGLINVKYDVSKKMRDEEIKPYSLLKINYSFFYNNTRNDYIMYYKCNNPPIQYPFFTKEIMTQYENGTSEAVANFIRTLIFPQIKNNTVKYIAELNESNTTNDIDITTNNTDNKDTNNTDTKYTNNTLYNMKIYNCFNTYNKTVKDAYIELTNNKRINIKEHVMQIMSPFNDFGLLTGCPVTLYYILLHFNIDVKTLVKCVITFDYQHLDINTFEFTNNIITLLPCDINTPIISPLIKSELKW